MSSGDDLSAKLARIGEESEATRRRLEAVITRFAELERTEPGDDRGSDIPERPWSDPAGLERQDAEHDLSEAMRALEDRVRAARRRVTAHDRAVRRLTPPPPPKA